LKGCGFATNRPPLRGFKFEGVWLCYKQVATTWLGI
jgi:hypothetical protein